MARLSPLDDAKPWNPPSEALIGRSTMCTLQIDAADVSKEHASLRWVGDGWELRDLGSRNGTFVGGQRLAMGERASLLAGTVVRFGATAGYMVDDDGPPTAMARREDTGEWVAAAHRMLVLPSDDDPVATVHQDVSGRWVLELDGEASEVVHGGVVSVAGATWRLSLPSLGDRTSEHAPSSRMLQGARLVFRVSSDEEHVALVVRTATEEIDLKARAHHQLALTLARLRLRDEAADVAKPEQGWVYHDELARMLATERTHVNVAIHRLRKQLEDAAFVDAASCVERRLTSGQLRLGVSTVKILPAE
jgi:hypothetical protein